MSLASLKTRCRKAMLSTDVTWRYLLNYRSALEYRLHAGALPESAAHVTNDLRRDGIAMVPAGQLLGQNSLYDALLRSADRLESDWAPRLAELRASYQAGSAGGIQKPYSIVLLPKHPPSPADLYTQFALQSRVLDVVNAYFGMYSVLTECNVWHNFVAAGAPSQSQLWHRDPEDRHIMKVFLYLSDVDEGAGPFVYARGSHRRPERVAPHSHLDGETPRSEDAEMAALVPPDRWLTAFGARGTIVFADTRGYHKGGWSRSVERVVYVCEFLSSRAHGLSTRDFHLNPERIPVQVETSGETSAQPAGAHS
jgi:hypothetical protein